MNYRNKFKINMNFRIIKLNDKLKFIFYNKLWIVIIKSYD